MSVPKKFLIVLLFLFLSFYQLKASEEILIRLEGSYLAYSYDLNQIYGENIGFQISSFSVSCRYIKIDISRRIFCSYGNVILKSPGETLSGDEFLFDPKERKGVLINYKEKVEVKEIGEEGKEFAFDRSEVLGEINLSKIQKSFLYFTGQLFQITMNFDVYGYNVIPHIEGLEFVGFKKFKLSGGINQRRNGISLDKIWYTKSQGLIGRVSYFYEKEKKINSSTQLNYEEHSVLKGYQGLKRQADVMSSTTVNFNENLNLGLAGNYNSSSLWNASLWLNKNWSNKINTKIDFSFNKPINLNGEVWFGLQSSINTRKFGNIAFFGKYGIQNQILSNFSYTKTLLKSINFRLSSSYSQVRIGREGDYSKIFSGEMNASYSSRLFNLSTDYFLNYDLFGEQLLSQPQLRIGLNPFQFYGGLLSANISNMFIYNNFMAHDVHEASFSNNTFINLSAQPIFVQKRFSLDFNLALEQFIEKKGRNFTSGGLIIHANENIADGISFEGFYSIQSRRKTKSWLIEGTTSQDMSALFKLNPSERLNSWVSFSFDPKNNQWRQSFADLSFELIKNWKFHSLLNYDFALKKINNIDLYLIREAGRFQLRFIWRSLSRQILVELVPR